MHALLQAQLGRLNLDEDRVPTPEEWRAFLAKVDHSYALAETDHDTLERSLGSYAAEVKQLYVDLRQASAGELAIERDKLRELTHFLDSIVENIPDLVFVKDANTLRFVRVNRAAEDILGLARSALIPSPGGGSSSPRMSRCRRGRTASAP